jgi:hypothetical protein
MGKPDFTRKLAGPIKPAGGPGVLLETLENAARFIAPRRALVQPERARGEPGYLMWVALHAGQGDRI